ncbi:MAG: ABC transporter permease [Marinilabiliales bacterium]|nr:ABC transporter permease [Marinilabiliales bacterium]
MPVINPEVRMYFNPNLESHFMFVPGVITLILILITALMTSVTIVREKEFGTMEVLLVSPLKPWQIIIGKVAPYFFLSLVNVIVILLMAWFVFGLPVRGSIVLLIAETYALHTAGALHRHLRLILGAENGKRHFHFIPGTDAAKHVAVGIYFPH